MLIAIGELHPLAHAAIAVGMAIIGIFAFYGCWGAADSPLLRHVLGICDVFACRRCQRESRNQRVAKYVEQARARRKKAA